MKTLKEFVKEIEGSEELLKEFEAIKNKDEAAEFLKKYDCTATLEEFVDFLNSQSEGELSDIDVENVAGGRATPLGSIPVPRWAL